MSAVVELLSGPDFPLLVSPPGNRVELFQAAFEAGADAAKVHLNVEHRASGRRFGSWAEERPAIEAILAAAAGPVGVMPGAETVATEAELAEMAAAGIDFLDVYRHHMPAWMYRAPMGVMVAVGTDATPAQVAALEGEGMQVLELSIVDPADYGARLAPGDLDRYRQLVAATSRPAIVPSQKALVPEDLARLAEVGVAGVLLGTLSLGDSAEDFRTRLPAFREAADALGGS